MGYMVQTSYDLRPGSRVAASRNLGPGASFFALDHDYGILLTFILDVPYSVLRQSQKFRSNRIK